MAAERVLHHREACAQCEKVRLALALEGLPYRSVTLGEGEQGPHGAPALVEGDTVITEATPILRHLAARPGSRLLPAARRDQALTWALVAWSDGVLGPTVAALASAHDADGTPLRDDDLKVLEHRLGEELAVLDGVLGRGPYLFGDEPTLADICAHAWLRRLEAATARPLPERLVRARAWLDRLEAVEGPR